jgi:cyclopropane fatty-acyl-phospholipid synthase-like methyltransferase
MAGHVCPWWVGYLLVSPIRRWMQDPEQIIAPYVTPGMTVLEPGPGMGFFTLPLARRVGSGRVIAIDTQQKMLDGLKRRATKAGLVQRIETRLAKTDALGIEDLRGRVDFVLAMAVVHEMPSAGAFFREAGAALAPGGRLLLAEPAGHVSEARFAKELAAAESAGLAVKNRPMVKRCLAAVLAKASGID